MTQPSPRATRMYGCATVLFTLGVMCVLLVTNGMATVAVYRLLADLGLRHIQDPRVAQAFLLGAPLVMMCVEWWLIDLIVDLQVTRRQQREARHLKNGDKSDVQSA